MTGSLSAKTRLTLLLVLLCLAALAWTTASADDPQTLKLLPGLWASTDPVEGDDGETREVTLDLAFGENGQLGLRCDGGDGAVWTCDGTWAFAFVPDEVDRLTCVFTRTDNPLHAGEDYRVTCVYGVYTESWVEDDTEVTALILEAVSSDGISPIEEIYGWDGAAVYRRKGPNMQMVKCKDYVSLREKPATGSARLAKVPLGEKVLAWPEAGEENGFIRCCWHDTYGYILAEYLAPVEP